jgi:putative spermidine/putrescine transport system substrate-binding protein
VVGKDGKQYGVPVIGNADSFGYFPDKLGVSAPKQELSWAVMFEDDKTRGRVAYDQTWTYSFPLGGALPAASWPGPDRERRRHDRRGGEAGR